jgi:hypothetical protein
VFLSTIKNVNAGRILVGFFLFFFLLATPDVTTNLDKRSWKKMFLRRYFFFSFFEIRKIKWVSWICFFFSKNKKNLIPYNMHNLSNGKISSIGFSIIYENLIIQTLSVSRFDL